MAKKRHPSRSRERYLPVRAVAREGWETALEVGGVVQSVTIRETGEGGGQLSSGGYWDLMLPANCPRRALLLGLGAGTVAHLLAGRCPRVEMVGIERNADVLVTARTDFGLDDLTRLRVVETDAFSWVAEHAETEPASYDLICLDLFEAGRLTAGALATAFLRQVALLLTPPGILTVNLLVTARTPEQRHRLRKVFVVERELRLKGNLVVHCRLPRTGETVDN